MKTFRRLSKTEQIKIGDKFFYELSNLHKELGYWSAYQCLYQKKKEQISEAEQELFEKDKEIARLENDLEEICEELFLEVNLR